WAALDNLVEIMHTSSPDFLRRGGEYDAWIISRNTPEGGLLRGVESWFEVEAWYIHFLVSGPMTWLGLVELASDGAAAGATFFRKSAWYDELLEARGTLDLPVEDAPVAIASTGVLTMTNLTPRIARYQFSRFCEWLEISPRRYQYRLTPGSLKTAENQGLTTRHLVSLLRKYSGSNPPPALVQAIQRWQAQGREAWMKQTWVLRLSSPEMLQALRDSPAEKYLGESLGPVSVIVQPAGIEKVRTALARLGYLMDVEGGLE
ncbi:MAG: helicase-associated domain-containing protein, partial [Anaerolineaceae bacterium]